MHIAREEKLAQLERVLHGRALHGSDNLKAFLRFIVGRSIEDHEGQLKEYVIATEVFGRGNDFEFACTIPWSGCRPARLKDKIT